MNTTIDIAPNYAQILELVDTPMAFLEALKTKDDRNAVIDCLINLNSGIKSFADEGLAHLSSDEKRLINIIRDPRYIMVMNCYSLIIKVETRVVDTINELLDGYEEDLYVYSAFGKCTPMEPPVSEDSFRSTVEGIYKTVKMVKTEAIERLKEDIALYEKFGLNAFRAVSTPQSLMITPTTTIN